VDWIRKEHKYKQNMSNQWKELTFLFPTLGSHLSWHVVNWTQVRIIDISMGCIRDSTRGFCSPLKINWDTKFQSNKQVYGNITVERRMVELN